MVKGCLGEKLVGCRKAGGESDVLAMQDFAAGPEKENAAISAAITLELSNGQVEGQVNRPKLRKRQLYGRAKFSLLIHYVLNPA